MQTAFVVDGCGKTEAEVSIAESVVSSLSHCYNIIDRFQTAKAPITWCASCQTCFSSGRCAIKDCMQDVYVKEAQSDILVLLSPLVHGSLNQFTKKCLDRLLATLHPSIVAKNGLTFHPLRSYKKRGLLPIVFAPPDVIEEEKKVFECAIKVFGNHFPLGCIPVFISTTWNSAQIEREIVQVCDTLKQGVADAPLVPLIRELADTYVPSPSEHSQRVLIIAASRNMKGLTSVVSQQVAEFLQKNHSDVHVDLITGNDPAKVAVATKSVDTIILIFPIYFFSCPGLVLAIMDEISANGPRPDLKVFALSHFALYDPEIGLAAIGQVKLWTKSLNAIWTGYASGPLVPHHPVAPIFQRQILQAVSDMIVGKPVTGARWKIPIPQWSYVLGGNLHMAVDYGWISMLSSRQPYTPGVREITPRTVYNWFGFFAPELVIVTFLLFLLYKVVRALLF